MKDTLIEVGKSLRKFILCIILGLLVVLVFWALGLWELIKLSGKFLLRKPLIAEGSSSQTALEMFATPFILIGYILFTRELKRELRKINL